MVRSWEYSSYERQQRDLNRLEHFKTDKPEYALLQRAYKLNKTKYVPAAVTTAVRTVDVGKRVHSASLPAERPESRVTLDYTSSSRAAHSVEAAHSSKDRALNIAAGPSSKQLIGGFYRTIAP
mmetsp:Transcript_27559/g.33456  ORF Transcript_27559/g.33456 Transcript_27559/m.33456 type:complete len:123 (+) Transcript_27559:349-717(+)